MPCTFCGQSICQCNQTYNYNWYNTEGLPCTTCTDTIVCKKKIPAKCTIFNGANLDALGLTSPSDLEVVIAAINTAIGALQILNQTQGLININILANLNDINDRINVIDSGSHIPYTL